MATNYGSPRSNALVLGVVAAAGVGIFVYVLATGRASNPIVFVAAAIAILAIGTYVFFKRARPK